MPPGAADDPGADPGEPGAEEPGADEAGPDEPAGGGGGVRCDRPTSGTVTDGAVTGGGGGGEGGGDASHSTATAALAATGSVGVVTEIVVRPTAPSPGPAAIAARTPAAASATPEAARRKVLDRTSL